MNPICESLKMKYFVLTGFSKEEKSWIEQESMLEIQELKKVFGIKEALLYSYQLQNLEVCICFISFKSKTVPLKSKVTTENESQPLLFQKLQAYPLRNRASESHL